jgi:trigger factor
LNDAFAQQISDGQVETLLQLRINTRENLAKTLQQRAEQDYAAKVLDSLVEQARLEYPDVMIEEYVDHMVQNLEQNLRQRGLTLKDFLKINKLDEATLRQQYRPQAEQRLKRSLVLGEIVGLENLSVTDTEIDAEIKQRSAIFAEGNEQMQQALEEYLGAELPRRNITLDMITDLAYRRLIAIAKGEALPEATAASEIEATAAALPNEAEPGQAADHTAA